MINIFFLTSALFLDLASTIDLHTELGLPPEGSPFKQHVRQCGMPNLCETDGTAPGCRDPTSGQDYIRGGERVLPFKYPWIVLIYITDYGGPCGGTLISVRHVLTSRQCMIHVKAIERNDWDVRKPSTSGKIHVWLSPYRKNSIPSDDPSTWDQSLKFEARSEVIEVKIPPVTYGFHDLALLRIKDVQFSDFVRPICLPYDGIPLDGGYSFAGWGAVYSNGTFRSSNPNQGVQVFPSYLQEIKNLRVEASDLKPAVPRPDVPWAGDWRHNGSTVNSTLILTLTGKKTPCNVDIGNALMWHHARTKRHYIIGLLFKFLNDDQTLFQHNVCSDENKQEWVELRFTKVTYFLDYIYREMNPDGFANNLCLPAACKDLNTTYITKDNLLSAPCGYVDGGRVGSFCMTGGLGAVSRRRNLSLKTKSDFLDNGFAECVRCPGGEKNWNYQQWINEITLGSFSEVRSIIPRRYRGEESPYDAFAQSYFKGIFKGGN